MPQKDIETKINIGPSVSLSIGDFQGGRLRYWPHGETKKNLCAGCLVVVVDTSVGLSLQVKCPRLSFRIVSDGDDDDKMRIRMMMMMISLNLNNNILSAMEDCVKHDRLSSMHFLTTWAIMTH